MASQVDLVNRALLSIGARSTVSSIAPSDGSTEADAAAILFQPTFESLGRSAHWNCLRKQATLSLLAAATGTPENPNGTTLPLPPTPWLYSYELPADCLAMRFIVPSLPAAAGGVPPTTFSNAAPIFLPGGGQIPYAVAYSTDSGNSPIQIILTNQAQAQAVYTVNQSNPIIWDSLFQSAMVASLAAFFVPALSLHIPLMQAQINIAERMITQARTRDGNESVVTQDHLPDWMAARGFRNGYGWDSGGFLYGGYCAMNWPIG